MAVHDVLPMLRSGDRIPKILNKLNHRILAPSFMSGELAVLPSDESPRLSTDTGAIVAQLLTKQGIGRGNAILLWGYVNNPR